MPPKIKTPRLMQEDKFLQYIFLFFQNYYFIIEII